MLAADKVAALPGKVLSVARPPGASRSQYQQADPNPLVAGANPWTAGHAAATERGWPDDAERRDTRSCWRRNKCRGILPWIPSTGPLHFHRHGPLPWLVNEVRYSQVRSGSCRVTHSPKASVHIAIHNMLRVTCHSRFTRPRPPMHGQVRSMGVQCRRKPNGHQIGAEDRLGE
jgi:hypothetical protein